MYVVNLLSKRFFAEYLKRIRMMLPNGVLMIAFAPFPAKLEERLVESVVAEVLNDTPRGNSVQESKSFSHFLFGADKEMNVIGHYYVCEDQNAVPVPNLPERVAKYLL